MNSTVRFSPWPTRLLAAAMLLSIACRACADVVTDWSATSEACLRNPTPNPAIQARTAAIVHGAMYDALNAIAKKYAPLRVTDPAPAGARAEAAAAQAAYTTLLALFPAKQTILDAQLAASLAQLTAAGASAQSVTTGRAWGETVAQQILSWRANDGFASVLTYPGSTAAGNWRHLPNGAAPAASLSSIVTAPFALTNLASFDPGPPYGAIDRNVAMATAAYAADVNELKARGGSTSAVRTPAQADLALFINVSDLTDGIAAVRRSLPSTARPVDNARTLALVSIAANDATIITFQAKYKYGLWRPNQAINFADEDGNPATVADPTWVPLATTPSHPEYFAAHCTILTAVVSTAAALLGNETKFTLTTSNTGAPAITPSFDTFSAFSDAVTEARVNAGFHFRSSCNMGQAAGNAVAKQLLANALTPLPGSGFTNLAVRGRAGTGDDTLIAGLMIPSAARQMLIRAVGPSLQPFAVGGVLADPNVTVYDSTGQIVAQNDNWSSGIASTTAALVAATARTGTFPLPANSLDAAVLITLGPGSYTVHAGGPGSSTGVVLIEAYEVP